MSDTLSPEQINNWRKIIAIQLDSRMPGAGAYAIVMSDKAVIDYWRKMKAIVEQPEPPKYIPQPEKKVCDHQNSIVGNRGRYCIDCEKYII